MKKLVCLFLVFLSSLEAFEKAPWFGNVYEFQSRLAHTHYWDKHDSVAVGKGTLLFTPAPEWSAELEVRTDRIGVSGRYLCLDDLLGDPVSCTIGVTAVQNYKYHYHRKLLFHHAPQEASLNIAVGREFGITDDRYFRGWLYGEVGQTGWIASEAHLEAIFQEHQFVDLFLHCERRTFHTLDLGLAYRVSRCGWASVYFECRKRLQGGSAKSIEVGFVIPFSF